ncbi:hypothetical protein [Aeoliella mucimassa]|uniref:Uncharacterized protein n=1 Tax=Aeoliella mucimassa TaxID=2527972 RepID=A0A518AJJ4_9BACT|nr:hypothetical protein [Aeoliella mucimassa]QDU54885.1 hypothetical protein Pan181_10690 [Aeoliella mucimassa]
MSTSTATNTLAPIKSTGSNPPLLDEAFAIWTDCEIRVDQGETSKTASESNEETKQLFKRIQEQMVAIDEQRLRLAQLLTDLNIPADF